MSELISNQIKRLLEEVKNVQARSNLKQWNIDLEYVMIGLESHLATAEKYEELEG